MQDIDQIDRKLLRLLQTDSTKSTAELAAAVDIPVPTAWRRIERLQAAGIIISHAVQIDPAALGYTLEVSLRITLDKTRPAVFDIFIDAARKIPEISEIQTFLGRVDVRLNVLARDLAHYQQLYRDHILALPAIADIEALMLISTVQQREVLPL